MQKQIDEVELLLKKSPQHRSKAEIDLLVKLTSQLPFFKQYTKSENGIQIQRKCCKNMYCEKFKSHEIVFYVDSVGTKFYIILEGQVMVLVRKPNQIEMEAVRILNKGESFGELALLHKQPRLATIQCLTECTFAVLDKQQFKHILQEEQQKQLDENIDYFSQIKIFSHLHRTQLKHIYLNSFLYEFEKNQIVIQEGQKVDYFILIKSGSFLVKKFIRSNQTNANLFEIGELQVFGFYHLNINLPYEYSLICNSAKGYAYKIQRTSLVERMFEQQFEELKLHRIELQQFAELRTQTDAKTASNFPQYYSQRIKSENLIESPQKSDRLIETTKKIQQIQQIKKQQRNKLIKQQLEFLSQKQRKHPIKVIQSSVTQTQSELFLKSKICYNFVTQNDSQEFDCQQIQKFESQVELPKNKIKKLTMKTHFPEELLEKQSCNSPLSTSQSQLKSRKEKKRMILPKAQNRIKSRTFQSQTHFSPLFKTQNNRLQLLLSSTNSNKVL
ncbi:unnamed protein product [Paramecium primaurelia]|uniref:Cyclic nucleotide-binding domain-containing protein n=1 Tax=Paramecium primaurelia TaxID=5886 RepID=A0A8S1M9V8_PARPR|nr:unnamed protein product [Paramecium primaurelia]